MTRETKIGLLVGLGFIVVFAVLLSHNGTGPSPAQGLPPIASTNSPESTRPATAELTPPPVIEPASGTGTVVHEDASTPGDGDWRDPSGGSSLVQSGTGDDLPTPHGFERLGVLAEGPFSGDAGVGDGLASAGAPREGTLESTRTVPPVVEPIEPAPTLRTADPITTMVPAATRDAATPPGNVEPSVGADSHAVPAPPKPYTVQKGDTLVKITKDVYGKCTPDVISFVVGANKGVIKDRDTVREGQVIVTPPLPPEMFERAGGTASSVDLRKVDLLLNSPDRRAPETTGPRAADNGSSAIPAAPTGSAGGYIAPRGQPQPAQQPDNKADRPGSDNKKKDEAKSNKSEKKETAPRTRPNLRLYQVQPKDTFTSIAQRELGSSARWAEIKRLNKDVDPTKMRPGTTLKLPARDPGSAEASIKQVSA